MTEPRGSSQPCSRQPFAHHKHLPPSHYSQPARNHQQLRIPHTSAQPPGNPSQNCERPLKDNRPAPHHCPATLRKFSDKSSHFSPHLASVRTSPAPPRKHIQPPRAPPRKCSATPHHTTQTYPAVACPPRKRRATSQPTSHMSSHLAPHLTKSKPPLQPPHKPPEKSPYRVMLTYRV